jgi:hypothetical protein
MNQFDHHNSTTDIQENILLEMMKQHISNGLSIPYSTNCKRDSIEFYLYKFDLF